MAGDAITLIKQDHRKMEKLFGRLKSERGERPRLLDEVEAMFIAHNRAEEAEVYPAIVRTTGEVPQVRHSSHEHHEAEGLLRQLRDCDPESNTFDKRLQKFVDSVKHHVEEEESTVLPALKRAVDEKRLNELGKAFDERRGQEMQRFHLGSGKIPRQRDLYEEAQELGIKDRSKMNKDELADAVQRARQH